MDHDLEKTFSLFRPATFNQFLTFLAPFYNLSDTIRALISLNFGPIRSNALYPIKHVVHTYSK